MPHPDHDGETPAFTDVIPLPESQKVMFLSTSHVSLETTHWGGGLFSNLELTLMPKSSIPAGGGAAPASGKKIATAEQIAALNFEPFDVTGDMPSNTRWAEMTNPHLVVLVQIAGTSKRSLLRRADFRPQALRSRLQARLERQDVQGRTVPCGCDASTRCRRS
ncbi:hypothetical protein SAMN05519103_06366 [Rhizobiales bacterium GAS113]|nr:hypothetical protein SAMN05519103_06366 [Rhizobiales bacterium GAS113]